MKNGYLYWRVGLLALIGLLVTAILIYKAVKLDRIYRGTHPSLESEETLNIL